MLGAGTGGKRERAVGPAGGALIMAGRAARAPFLRGAALRPFGGLRPQKIESERSHYAESRPV